MQAPNPGMAMYKIPLKFKLIPKPRGKLSKDGHIYHSSRRYLDYKRKVITATKYTCSSFGCLPYAVGLFYGYKQTSHETDIDNIVGGLFDALVSGNMIKDDNRSVIPFLIVTAKPQLKDESYLIISSYLDRMSVVDEIYKLSGVSNNA